MIEATNRRRGRSADDGGMFGDLAHVLADPEAQPIIRRVYENTCAFSPIDREQHALRVAAVALIARRAPFNKFARPTLPVNEEEAA